MRDWMKLGLMAALALAVPAAARQAPAANAALAGRTQALVDRYVAEGKAPGLVIGYGRRGAPTQFAAAGRIAIEPGARAADAGSLWRVYSMTKPITGIAAMILVEEGKLGLDQPISDFIPAFASMTVLVPGGTGLESRPATVPITVRHLLTHTAGLGYSVVTTGPLLDAYNRNGINPAAVNAAMEPLMRMARAPSLEEFANRVAALPLIAEPGTRWSYSISLDLLGRVIEIASGMPFDAFLQQRLFDPLDMDSTVFAVPPGEAGRLSTNYYWTGTTRTALDPGATSVWLSPPSFPYGGAGLVSSARDYDRFLAMLQNGGELDGVRVLEPETVALAMSNLLPEGTDTAALRSLSGVNVGFGAGGSVYLTDAPGGPGKGTWGWAGAAGTIAWVDPTHGIRGTVMVNYFPADQWPMRADAIRAIYADVVE